jgi:hypothetical protein
LTDVTLSPAADKIAHMSDNNNDDKPDWRKLIESLLRRQFEGCNRCKRRTSSDQGDAADWSIRAFAGVPFGTICPDCQTPEERAELEIRGATSTYTLEGLRFVQHSKPVDDDEDDQDHPRSA